MRPRYPIRYCRRCRARSVHRYTSAGVPVCVECAGVCGVCRKGVRPMAENPRFMHWLREMQEHIEDNYDEPHPDAYEMLQAECGKFPDGSCTMAGSEYCDWECPFSLDDDADDEE